MCCLWDGLVFYLLSTDIWYICHFAFVGEVAHVLCCVASLRLPLAGESCNHTHTQHRSCDPPNSRPTILLTVYGAITLFSLYIASLVASSSYMVSFTVEVESRRERFLSDECIEKLRNSMNKTASTYINRLSHTLFPLSFGPSLWNQAHWRYDGIAARFNSNLAVPPASGVLLCVLLFCLDLPHPRTASSRTPL